MRTNLEVVPTDSPHVTDYASALQLQDENGSRDEERFGAYRAVELTALILTLNSFGCIQIYL